MTDDEYYGATEMRCVCCRDLFRSIYIESWCPLCRNSADCLPGSAGLAPRCGLDDDLPPDPAAVCQAP